MGLPLLLVYCSDNPPLEGVYLALMAMNPSAKVLTAEVRVVNVEVVDAYVPAVTEEEN